MPLNSHIFRSKFLLLLLAAVLFAVSFFFNKEFSGRAVLNHEVRLAEKYLQTQEKEFEKFMADSALVNRLMNHEESLQELTEISNRRFSVFIYQMPPFRALEMKFWSDQQATPPADLVQAGDGEYFRQLLNGKYAIIKRSAWLPDSTRLFFFGMIPVHTEYFIVTDYLPQEFSFSSTAEKQVLISKTNSGLPVRSSSGTPLFYLEKKSNGPVAYNDFTTLLLRFGALLFLLLFIHFWTEDTADKQGPWKGVALLVLVLLFLRCITYFYPAVLNNRQFELFSPFIYGSNFIQRSLGDLLVNAVLICWIVLFSWEKLRRNPAPGVQWARAIQWAVGLLSLFLLIISSFVLAGQIRNLVSDSKISFDVTNFFSLNIYTIAGFAVLALLSLSFHYGSQLLLRLIMPLFGGQKILIYFGVAVTGLLYLTLVPENAEVLFNLPVLLWLLIFIWLITTGGAFFRRLHINVAGILLWIFVYSVSISVVMLSENNKLEWEKRKRMAERVSLESDISSEQLLSIAIQYIDNDFLTDNFERFRDPEKNRQLRDSLINENFKGYQSKYDTRLYVYDSIGTPLYNDDATSFETLNNILTVQAKKTNTEGLYYYENSLDRYNYITRRLLEDSTGRPLGSVFVVSNPKNYGSDALFPELFRINRQREELENSTIYSTGIYQNGQLKSPPGKYPFATSLQPGDIPREEFSRVRAGGKDELWYKVNRNELIVIARDPETFIETITLFSYIFCSFLILVALVQFIRFVLRTGFTWRGLKQMLQLNIRTQVHSTIIFISVFSFLIIGAATISFFISRFNRNNSEKLSRTMKIMVNEMQKRLKDSRTFDDQVMIYDTVSNVDLQKLVKDVAEIHGVDVNVYGLNGDLYVTSEANVYTKGVLSRKMDPVAFYHLSRLRQIQHAQEERIGKLQFFSIYSPVRDEEGREYCYINIPYFTTKPELDQEISNFLVTIINLNAFIFLVAGLIALLITNRITSSFGLISDKMKEVNLGKLNEPIPWNRNDEIGELVKEYNKMVAKLGESAQALAKSEREGAWREMARQVAHEIKNPLTPMKLSIQYLQKAISNNQPNVQELSASVARTLVEQIDHLSKIAADFSQFANIGNTHTVLFDLHEVIEPLENLYRNNERIELHYESWPAPMPVNADRTQLNRLFTNLLANAMEACADRPDCRITIREMSDNHHWLISIRDNGEGIPQEMHSRIFMPNFTTKSSGTGLGLAMCKGIVEKAGGEIWFETKAGEGTVFFVKLPQGN